MKAYTVQPLTQPVHATVAIPGSKSYTNRALLLAAMTPGSTKIVAPLISDDTEAMVSCLQALGLTIRQTNGFIEVANDITAITSANCTLDARLSGTTIRFLLALACVMPGAQILTGGEGLCKRPIGDLVDALRAAGAAIEYLGKEGFPPLKVTSSKLTTNIICVNGAMSSQYLSALLMIAPVAGIRTIAAEGELISEPYVAMTLAIMRDFGVSVAKTGQQYAIPHSAYHAAEYTVEGDMSSASYFAAIAALTGSTITLANIHQHSAQADREFIRLLEQLGGINVNADANSITVQGTGAKIKPFQVNMQVCPDQAMTMAVLAAFTHGTSTIAGVRSLRVKETERVVALEQELAKMGIKTSSTHDVLTIHGGNPQPAVIATYGDHRMAMAFAVAGSLLNGMKIRNPEVVGKTFPGFWDALQAVGVAVQLAEINIALIGMRGSGKTTVAKLLGQKLGWQVIDNDDAVTAHVGQTIPQIIEHEGWEAFRKYEAEVTATVAKKQGIVISTGGGVVLRPENIAALRQSSILVYLQTDLAVLEQRIASGKDRPALTKQQTLAAELAQLLQERQPLYKMAADVTITTNSISPEEVAQQIIQRLQEQTV